MAPPKTIPLKITAWLTDGRFVSEDGIIMLDALIYHAWFLKYFPQVYEGGASDNFDGHIGLPLKKMPGNRYHASKGAFREVGQRLESYHKSPDFLHPVLGKFLSQTSGQISESVGVHRAYRNYNSVRVVEDSRIDFWCVGNPEKVVDLLNYLPAIGKKTAQGYGGIRKWEVRKEEADYSIIHPEHGLMRPTPVEEMPDLKGYPIIEYAVRPPYWKDKNKRLCHVPIGG